MAMLFSFGMASCTKEEIEIIKVGVCKDANGVIIDCPTNESCGTQILLSDHIWEMSLDNGDKIIMQHTEAVRKMARTGNTNDLHKQMCNWNPKPTSFLKTGHKSDINRIGFAPQLEVGMRYIIAMYHPNNYPDHFIIYDKETKDWTRWEENGRNPRIYSKGNGD